MIGFFRRKKKENQSTVSGLEYLANNLTGVEYNGGYRGDIDVAQVRAWLRELISRRNEVSK